MRLDAQLVLRNRAFMKFYEELLLSATGKLDLATDAAELYRAQGAKSILARLKQKLELEANRIEPKSHEPSKRTEFEE